MINHRPSKRIKRGAATVVFLTVIALVLMLILAATQSQLMLSLNRSQSATDTMIATYAAESEVNDIMAKLLGKYIDTVNIPHTVKNVGDIRIEVEGSEVGNVQTVNVTAFKGFAVGKVEGIRKTNTGDTGGPAGDTEVVLMLDCTSSMSGASGTAGETRMQAEASAAANFVRAIAGFSDADRYKVGVGVFGTDASWLNYNGEDTTPDSSFSFSDLANIIEQSFGPTRADSQCLNTVLDGTSIGSSYIFAHNYFKANGSPDARKIEIVITDGEPTTRIPDSYCQPDVYCTPITYYCSNNPYSWECLSSDSAVCDPLAANFLRCSLADSNTYVSEIEQNGSRDPNVEAYAVTIFDSPPAEVVEIFKKYTVENGYYNATQANQLTDILQTILKHIVESSSSLTIKRVIPKPQ